MRIIRDGQVVEDNWLHLADSDEIAAGPITVSINRWRNHRAEFRARSDRTGLRLSGADSLQDIVGSLSDLPIIVLEFTAMADGRIFSHARLLRERYGFKGELRARGDFIPDQVFFLSRVGVNAFEFGEENALAEGLRKLSEFSVKYQAAADEKHPLYRRRLPSRLVPAPTAAAADKGNGN